VRGLWTPKWVLVHIAVVVLVVVFLRLGWWQVTRAADGNLLSFGYALQWPAFAVFVIFVWIKEIQRARSGPVPASSGLRSEATEERSDEGRRRPEGPGPARAERAQRSTAYEDGDDENLAAYNRYLAWLNAHPEASPREYPG
jgi:DNA-binding transcriptional regulator of glucitol operon